ncbi:MAG: hypothetical protein H0T76_24675 [Nannocystis sp.]|nr:hypothetical protein [Nannocystis sp.]MBA3549686.1 hypothetical protein [Nannocystis sp.]
MTRVKIGLVLGCMLGCMPLGGCKTVRVYPIAGPQGDPQALFEPLIVCATAERLTFQLKPGALHVLVKPGIWAQFTPRRSLYTLVLVVDDGSSGGDREGNIAAAKRKSEELFACARPPDPVPAPAAVSAAEATNSAEVEAMPGVTPGVTPADPPADPPAD